MSDKFAAAFAKLSERPKVLSGKPYRVSGKYVTDSRGNEPTFRKGYSVSNVIESPIDDDRFLGRFGLMDKFLSKIPECVLRGAWLHYFDTKDLAHLDIAICGGMRKRFLQALKGYIIITPDYEVTRDSFTWLMKRGVRIESMGICLKERDLDFMLESREPLTWLKSLNISLCDQLTGESLLNLPAGFLPNVTSLNISNCSHLESQGVLALLATAPQVSSLKSFQVPYMDDELVEEITNICGAGLTALDVGGCPDITDVGVIHLANELEKSIVRLSIAYSSISILSLTALASCEQLTHLNLQGCTSGVTDDGVAVICTSCRNLTHFDLSGCQLITQQSIYIIAANLSALVDIGSYLTLGGVTADALIALSEGCPVLAVIGFNQMQSVSELSPAAFNAIATYFPNLTKLKLRYSHLTNRDVELFAETGRGSVEEIDWLCASDAHADDGDEEILSDDGFMALFRSCSNLTRFSFRRKAVLTDAALVALSQCCPALISLRIEASFISDTGLTALTEKCPHLAEVHLTAAFGLTDNGVEEFFAKGRSLRYVIIEECTEVSTKCIWEMTHKRPEVKMSLSNVVSNR